MTNYVIVSVVAPATPAIQDFLCLSMIEILELFAVATAAVGTATAVDHGWISHAYCPSKAAFALTTNAKVGSTTLKGWAAQQGEGHDEMKVLRVTPNTGNYVNLRLAPLNSSRPPVTVLRKVRVCASKAEEDSRFRWALVRHPLRRLVSAFHDKVETENCGYQPFRWVCTLPREQRWPEFVRRVASGQFRDAHSQPQLIHLRRFGIHRLQAIVRIEELDALWPWLLQNSAYRGRDLNLPHGNSKTNAANSTGDYFADPDLLAKLMRYYAEDLKALQYDPVEVVAGRAASNAAKVWREISASTSPRRQQRESVLLLKNGSVVTNFWVR